MIAAVYLFLVPRRRTGLFILAYSSFLPAKSGELLPTYISYRPEISNF